MRNGDAAAMTATTTATGTTGNDGEASPMRVTTLRLSRTLSLSTTSAPMRRARNHATKPAMARSRARRQRRATSAAATTTPTAHSAPIAKIASKNGCRSSGRPLMSWTRLISLSDRVSLVEAQPHHDPHRDDQAEPVTDAPSVRFLGRGPERAGAQALDREPGLGRSVAAWLRGCPLPRREYRALPGNAVP